MTSKLKIRYAPAEVPVSDERRQVAGAKVEIGGESYLVIPPEGPDPSAWMGGAECPEGFDEDEFRGELASAAALGAQDLSGVLEIRDTSETRIVDVYRHGVRVYKNMIDDPSSPLLTWKGGYGFVIRSDIRDWEIREV